MIDEREKEVRKKFPLRKIRLDLCECGHDDSDHSTEIDAQRGVTDGECLICVCKEFMVGVEK